ncbi:MAG: DNA polymerase III subunit delta [bacterium]|jgi:DNA polymerase-3 subunit delta
MKWQQVWANLEQKQVASCYLLGGEETYLIRQTVDKIESSLELADLADINVEKLMASDTDIESLMAACTQIPWLAKRRLVVVQGLNLSVNQPDWLKDLPYLVGKLPLSTCLVLCTDGRLSSRHKVAKAVAVSGAVVEFPRLKGRELEKWVSQRAGELGISWRRGTLTYFLQRTVPYLEQLEAELQKLAAYAAGNAQIGCSEIDLLVPESRESRVFSLSDAVLAKDREKALTVLAELLRQGETPIGLVGLLAHQVRVVGLVKAALEEGVLPSDLAKTLDLHPFVAQKAAGLSRRFTWNELYQAVRTMACADLKLKSTSLPAKLVLEEAILSF